MNSSRIMMSDKPLETCSRLLWPALDVLEGGSWAVTADRLKSVLFTIGWSVDESVLAAAASEFTVEVGQRHEDGAPRVTASGEQAASLLEGFMQKVCEVDVDLAWHY